MMKDNELDDFFKKSIKDKEISPSNELWERIEQQLDEQRKIIPIKKQNTKWQIYSLAASLALVLGISVLTFHQQDEVVTAKVAQTQTNENKQDTKSKVSVESTETTATAPNLIANQEDLRSKATKSNQSTTILDDFQDQETLLTANILIQENAQEEQSNADAQLYSYQAKSVSIEESTARTLEIHNGEPTVPTLTIRNDKAIAANVDVSKAKENMFTKLLNVAASTIEISPNKNLHFSNDEEGSIQINVIKSYALNTK